MLNSRLQRLSEARVTVIPVDGPRGETKVLKNYQAMLDEAESHVLAAREQLGSALIQLGVWQSGVENAIPSLLSQTEATHKTATLREAIRGLGTIRDHLKRA